MQHEVILSSRRRTGSMTTTRPTRTDLHVGNHLLNPAHYHEIKPRTSSGHPPNTRARCQKVPITGESGSAVMTTIRSASQRSLVSQQPCPGAEMASLPSKHFHMHFPNPGLAMSMPCGIYGMLRTGCVVYLGTICHCTVYCTL